MSVSILNNVPMMFSQLVNNGNTMFSNVYNTVSSKDEMFSTIFNEANDMLTNIFYAPTTLVSDLFNSNEHDYMFVQMVKDAATIFVDVSYETYNKVYDDLTTSDDETNNGLVYETSFLDTSLFTHTKSELTIVANNNAFFVSPLSIGSPSAISQIVNYGNTTINFIVNEFTMVASAIANKRRNYTTIFIQYVRAVSSRTWNYGSRRMLGETGYDRIKWIAQPSNRQMSYQVKCHYRDTIVTIRQDEAQAIVDLFGSFGKYHAMNCDGDDEKFTKHKLGLVFLAVFISNCILTWIIVHLMRSIRLLYSMYHSTSVESQPAAEGRCKENTAIILFDSKPRSTSVESQPTSEGRCDEHIADLQKTYEETYSFRCHYRKLQDITIPNLDDSQKVYDKYYETFRTTPTILQRPSHSLSQRTLTIDNHTLVLPEIATPTKEEYTAKFEQIYEHKRQTTHAEVPAKTMKYYISLLTFHAFEVQYCEKMQERVTLMENFWRTVDFDIAERKRQDIQAAIEILRDLDRREG